MKIVMSGASGLIGSALTAALSAAGYQVAPLTRHNPAPGQPFWNPHSQHIDFGLARSMDAVIHLAGENIVSGRWTAAKKARILGSRADGTRLLAEALARLEHRPQVLLVCSAIGYYGSRGEDVLDESAPLGTGFLAEVCRQWEEAAQPARDAGIRVVHMRLGVVLSPRGGALAAMLPLFRLGLGGVIGSGRQYMSWISIDDIIGAVQHLLQHSEIAGPANLVSPQPVTNREFTRTLGRTLHRPTLLPAPMPLLRLALGREKADTLLLSSVRAEPRALQESGYTFRHPDLATALRHLLT